MEHLESFIAVMDQRLNDADRPVFDALVHPGTAVADFFNTSEWMKRGLLTE